MMQFDVPAEVEALAPPELNDVTICGPGPAALIVNKPKAGTYRAYASLQSPAPIVESKNGILTVNTDTDKTFYVRYFNGSCESEATEVRVTIPSSNIDIPNTISPNGDGVNDTWEIKGLDNYQPLIAVYNRYGQAVFRSRGYQTSFPGERNGKLLPMGTYYYVIDLGTGCRMIKGSLFVVR